MHEEQKLLSSPDDAGGLDRRSFLGAVGGQAAAAGLLGGGRSTVLAEAGSSGAKTGMLIVDCHAHLYSAHAAREHLTKPICGLER